MRLTLAAALLSLIAVAAPSLAHAAPVEQLRCLDDKLSEQKRADIAGLFAEQPKDPKDGVTTAQGSASAAYDLTYALASCASQFGWNQPQQDAATQYLIRMGQLARIRLHHTPDWNTALERSAPLSVRLLTDEGEPGDHAQAMILAGARANNPAAVSADDGKDVVGFVAAWRKLEQASALFAQAR